MRSKTRSWLLLSVLLFAACGGVASTETTEPAPRSTTMAPSSAPTTLAPRDATTTTSSNASAAGEWYGGLLAIGDCFDDTIDADGEYVYTGEPLIVACAEPHHNEVIAVFEIGDDAYPGTDALGERGEELCDDAFAGFVGVEWSDGPLQSLWIWPEEDEWEAGGREVVCAVYLPDHGLRGSMEAVGTSVRPAEMPDHAPVPADAVFLRISETEEGDQVAMFTATGGLDEVGAATLASAAESGLELRLDGQTESLMLLRYSTGDVEYTIAIHGQEASAEWWFYYPEPVS